MMKSLFNKWRLLILQFFNFKILFFFTCLTMPSFAETKLIDWSAEDSLFGIPRGIIFLSLGIGFILISSLVTSLILTLKIITITQKQKIAQGHLYESEQKYRELVMLANSIILRWSHEGKITFLNEYGLLFFGYEEKEIIGKHVVGTIVPVTESAGRDLRTLMEDICEDPKKFERNVNENIRKNGERVWIDWTNKVVLDQNGKLKEILSIGCDITSRKKAEEQAKLSKSLIHYLSKFANDFIILLDENFCFLEMNERTLDFYGYSRQELIGKHASLIRSPEAKADFLKQIEILDKESKALYETIHQKKDGTIFPVEISIRAIDVEQTRFYQSVIRDITDRKRAEEELFRHTRELAALNTIGRQISATLFLSEVISAAMNGIMRVIEPDTAFIFLREGERLLLKGFAPDSAKNIYGTMPEHRVGECICGLAVHEGRALYSNDIYKDLRCTWEECKRAGVLSFAALPLQSGNEFFGVIGLSSNREREFEKQASFLETLTSQVAIGIRNAILHESVVKNAFDLELRVSERTRELEAAKEHAESADRVKSSFLATMSHELRTPLNSIIGFTGILIQGLAGNLNPEQEKQMKMVQKSAQHLLALINDVLDISKIEAGELDLKYSRFDLANSIDKVIRIIFPLAEKKGLAIHTRMDQNIGLIESDERRLEQVILNLLTNGIKFTEKGCITVSCTRKNEQVEISISDTGIGISEEEIKKLFQPFHQIDSGLSRKQEGTGLGLSISKKIADMMGGTIRVKSKLSEGSEFALLIPVSQHKEKNS